MHPLLDDLSSISTDELNKKYAELQKRYMQAYRFGPQAIIPQLQMVMDSYQSELAERNRKAMEEMEKRAQESGRGFKGIIDIS